MQRYTLTGDAHDRLALSKVDIRGPGAGEVAVDIQAASLNYRDLLVAQRDRGIVPLSDGAGVVSEVGEGVSNHSPGDRVVIGFMPDWVDGPITEAKKASSLGGQKVDGVLAERVVVPADGIVRIPDAMTFEHAASLPCAGVTAWCALFERRPVQPGETVLLLGTGGVSIFALKLAKMAGARVIITSSSDEKLARAKALGADHVVNYRKTPSWGDEVVRLTGGVGADLAVDVAGPATLNQTIRATRFDGRISLMGVLTGFNGPIETGALLGKRITLQGIYVGSVAALAAVVNSRIEPEIDRVFDFDRANAAYDALSDANHFGKLVIRVGR